MTAHAGTAIHAMRTAQDLTLRQLGALSGTSYSYMSLVERGLRTPTDWWLWSVVTALAKNLHSANTQPRRATGVMS